MLREPNSPLPVSTKKLVVQQATAKALKETKKESPSPNQGKKSETIEEARQTFGFKGWPPSPTGSSVTAFGSSCTPKRSSPSNNNKSDMFSVVSSASKSPTPSSSRKIIDPLLRVQEKKILSKRRDYTKYQLKNALSGLSIKVLTALRDAARTDKQAFVLYTSMLVLFAEELDIRLSTRAFGYRFEDLPNLSNIPLRLYNQTAEVINLINSKAFAPTVLNAIKNQLTKARIDLDGASSSVLAKPLNFLQRVLEYYDLLWSEDKLDSYDYNDEGRSPSITAREGNKKPEGAASARRLLAPGESESKAAFPSKYSSKNDEYSSGNTQRRSRSTFQQRTGDQLKALSSMKAFEEVIDPMFQDWAVEINTAVHELSLMRQRTSKVFWDIERKKKKLDKLKEGIAQQREINESYLREKEFKEKVTKRKREEEQRERSWRLQNLSAEREIHKQKAEVSFREAKEKLLESTFESRYNQKLIERRKSAQRTEIEARSQDLRDIKEMKRSREIQERYSLMEESRSRRKSELTLKQKSVKNVRKELEQDMLFLSKIDEFY
eukprot:TRINITY_DN1486_c0_g1_i3.p1 TRINITY_DN1486_c0_g1~~TRINITY_DN1486_c0_g1_i3.p1  ORF type:complete len:550 (+),score=114.54 TRINITY_DN1486_c0_g1_i3:42-1691(+)